MHLVTFRITYSPRPPVPISSVEYMCVEKYTATGELALNYTENKKKDFSTQNFGGLSAQTSIYHLILLLNVEYLCVEKYRGAACVPSLRHAGPQVGHTLMMIVCTHTEI